MRNKKVSEQIPQHDSSWYNICPTSYTRKWHIDYVSSEHTNHQQSYYKSKGKDKLYLNVVKSKLYQCNLHSGGNWLHIGYIGRRWLPAQLQNNTHVTIPRKTRRTQLAAMEKDTENSHTLSQDNNKQAKTETRGMDWYTQQIWVVAIVLEFKWKLLCERVQQRYRVESIWMHK